MTETYDPMKPVEIPRDQQCRHKESGMLLIANEHLMASNQYEFYGPPLGDALPPPPSPEEEMTPVDESMRSAEAQAELEFDAENVRVDAEEDEFDKEDVEDTDDEPASPARKRKR